MAKDWNLEKWQKTVARVQALAADADLDTRPAAGFTFYRKQWLSDGAVLEMDHTARGMHLHLLLLALDEDPPCSLPEDLLKVRAMVGHPAMVTWKEELWPQISRGWKLHHGRWWQLGLCRTYLQQMETRFKRRTTGQLGGLAKANASGNLGNASDPASKRQGHDPDGGSNGPSPGEDVSKQMPLADVAIATTEPRKMPEKASLSVDVDIDDDSGSKRRRTPIAPVDDFAEFWAVYPRKVAKGRAEKAWKATAKARPPIDQLLEAIEHAKHSAQWVRDGGDYIPHPASWLNAKGWLDELQPAARLNGVRPAPPAPEITIAQARQEIRAVAFEVGASDRELQHVLARASLQANAKQERSFGLMWFAGQLPEREGWLRSQGIDDVLKPNPRKGEAP